MGLILVLTIKQSKKHHTLIFPSSPSVIPTLLCNILTVSSLGTTDRGYQSVSFTDFLLEKCFVCVVLSLEIAGMFLWISSFTEILRSWRSRRNSLIVRRNRNVFTANGGHIRTTT